MRYGENALSVIDGIKHKIDSIKSSFAGRCPESCRPMIAAS